MSVPPIDPIQPNPSQPNQGAQPYQTGPKLNVLALIGFALAVTGTGCGIISLIISIIGYNQISREPSRYSGKGFALAGIIISILFILLILATILQAFFREILVPLHNGFTRPDGAFYP